VLLLEEFARVGVEVVFAKEPERGGTPEDELMREFQGLIAEYEREQIRERSRRGKAHRARQGSQAVMSGAPYGYRYVRKSQHMDAFYEIDEGEAEIVREIFGRYTERGESIADIARALSKNGVLHRTGKHVWDRSTVWAMLRNPAYHGFRPDQQCAKVPGRRLRSSRMPVGGDQVLIDQRAFPALSMTVGDPGARSVPGAIRRRRGGVDGGARSPVREGRSRDYMALR
jgi:hypothetical protein